MSREYKYCKIYPSIGIARVGNSPDGFFVGPEVPGRPADNGGSFRDAQGALKRQAARFRVVGFDENDQPVGEITSADATITWTAHLVNAKAAGFQFVGEPRANEMAAEGRKPALRNAGESDRSRLVIDPGPRSISGAGTSGPEYRFDGGRFYDREVALGELRTDSNGRLLVLGGAGRSESVRPENPIRNYANNDYWFDDTSDGPVKAQVVLKSGAECPLRGEARVLVTPPDFAPETENLVTLYDVMEEVAVDKGLLREPAEVSFDRDVLPILRRICGYQWVNGLAVRGHGPGRPGEFISRLGGLASNGPESAAERQAIFSRIRDPKPATPEDAKKQANFFFMPPLSGDGGDTTQDDPTTWLKLLPRQYRALQRWAAGDFVPGSAAAPAAAAPAAAAGATEPPVADLTSRLIRAALEHCVGGAFFPGIEMTYLARDPDLYVEPFRLDNVKLKPGDVIKWMALPWQADFYECQGNWWPAQRPDDVVTKEEYESVVKAFSSRNSSAAAADGGGGSLAAYLFNRVSWDRPVGKNQVDRPAAIYRPTPSGYESEERFKEDTHQFEDMLKRQARPAPPDAPRQPSHLLPPDSVRTPRAAEYPSATAEYRAAADAYEHMVGIQWDLASRYAGDNDMVKLWSQLGFVTSREAPDGSSVFVETDREPYAGLRYRDYFYLLMNLDSFADFRPRAKTMADAFLAEAWALQGDPMLADELRFFPYSPAAYNARLDEIYNNLATAADAFRPDDPDGLFKTREHMVERIRQLSPFNLLDGAWLRNSTRPGPISEIHALLFEIWSDEVGKGDPRLNHANLYRDLMHSVGLYPEEITTRQFADDPKLLDSAFRNPVFQLVISEFSEAYFPEILGMTVWLEWEVLELKQTIKLMKYHNLNPQFYEMHVGIDNAVDGHGAKAKLAVQTYLDHVRDESGEGAVQEHWRRIWNGYIAFKTIGMGDDLRRLIEFPPTIEDRLVSMIQRKATYARLNHGDRTLGANRINDLFDRPGVLLKSLLDAKYIVAGDPESSKFFKLMEFTGPMYKVFSADEIELWKQWVRSLAQDVSPAPAPGPADAMVALIEYFKTRQEGNLAHEQLRLKGEDPATPGTVVEQPVAWWFAQNKPAALMRALASPGNGWIVPGNAAASKWVVQLLTGGNRMAAAFAETVPSSDRTWRQVAVEWINAGCPMPGEAPRERLRADERDRAAVLSMPGHPATAQAARTGSAETAGIQAAPGKKGKARVATRAAAEVAAAADQPASADRVLSVSRQIAHLLNAPTKERAMPRPRVPRLTLNSSRAEIEAHPTGRILGNGTIH
ncbi:MAG: Lysine-epsilon oxidase [Phycisphaerales bacterium]|nr:Lysine-epsilon oxidase [Phycisphaerales bacterium]